MSKATIFNKYPPVIHGEARGENDEFVVHTRYPRFLARRSFDDNFTGKLPGKPVSGELVQDERGVLCYRSDVGVWFRDFVFFDRRPDDEAAFARDLLAACNKVVADGLMLDDETEGLDDDD